MYLLTRRRGRDYRQQNMQCEPAAPDWTAGDAVMVFGAWYHSYAAIAGGLLVILAAWLSGVVKALSS